MYERNAIILERYLSKVFGQNNETSIKASYNIYKEILEEMAKFPKKARSSIFRYSWTRRGKRKAI